ncbi:MAG TPA: MmgE/PrpD family protein [Gemmatimonadales bacterium]|nr:MmgE/PrpD family protein [Gemmatimonadales bacterium]
MTEVEELADFVVRTSYDDLSEAACQQFTIRILDALGCAIGALPGGPVHLVRDYVTESASDGPCTLIGGGRAAPDRAALLNGALVRYLDFNDSYLTKGESCHPSDNLGAVLAAAELAGASGRDLMAALATAYQVQCRLSDVAPVRRRGFDHTSQGAFAAAAGVARALGLGRAETANALAISGTALHALRVTRTGALSHWKGLAYSFTGANAIQAALLAARGVTGPLEVFEGNKGFMESIAGRFTIDWAREDLERVKRTVLKRYNAQIHSQTAIEGILELRRREHFDADDVERVDIEIFDVAFHIIGGGEEGDKTLVFTKEEADHSLPYLLAVALLDGRVMPEQYTLDRIQRPDVQALLCRVTVSPHEAYSRRFPEEMPCRLSVRLKSGRLLTREVRDYPGFYTQPMSWEAALEKFTALAEPYTTAELRAAIAEGVRDVARLQVAELTRLLAEVRVPTIAAPERAAFQVKEN